MSEFFTELTQAMDKRDDAVVFETLAFRILETHREEPALLRLLLFSSLEGHKLSQLFMESQVRPVYELLSGYIRQRAREGAFRKADAVVHGARIPGHGQPSFADYFDLWRFIPATRAIGTWRVSFPGFSYTAFSLLLLRNDRCLHDSMYLSPRENSPSVAVFALSAGFGNGLLLAVMVFGLLRPVWLFKAERRNRAS